jgi:hypothetical protein
MEGYVLGIDPGLEGAVGVVAGDGQPLGVYDTPVVVVTKGDSRRREPDVVAMAELVRKLVDGGDVRRVVLEKVQPMPTIPRPGLAGAQDARGQEEGWGAVANFALGHGYGLWRGILVALRVPGLELVPPQTWRARMLGGLPKGKEAGRLRAMELWPAMADQLKLKKWHGRADGLLLAEYGRRLG